MKPDIKKIAARIRTGINKGMQKEVVRSLTTTEELLQVSNWIEMPEYFSTAINGKGFPFGHISQIIGESDTGKTTLLMSAMIKVQQEGGICYLIDTEHKFHFERFRLMGGIPEDIETISVDTLEEAWTAINKVCDSISDIREDYPDLRFLVAWDSVAATVTEGMMEAESDAHHVAVEAKLNNKEIRKLKAKVRRNDICAIFINHTYMTMPTFGISKEVLKGGTEMFYMSTIIVKTKRREWLKRTIKGMPQKYGIHGLLEVFKGHVGGRKTTTDFYIVDKGIINKEELVAYQESIEGIL